MEPKPLFSAMTSVQYFSPSTTVSHLHLPIPHLVLIKSTAVLLLLRDLPQPSLTLAYFLPTQDSVFWLLFKTWYMSEWEQWFGVDPWRWLFSCPLWLLDAFSGCHVLLSKKTFLQLSSSWQFLVLGVGRHIVTNSRSWNLPCQLKDINLVKWYFSFISED